MTNILGLLALFFLLATLYFALGLVVPSLPLVRRPVLARSSASPHVRAAVLCFASLVGFVSVLAVATPTSPQRTEAQRTEAQTKTKQQRAEEHRATEERNARAQRDREAAAAAKVAAETVRIRKELVEKQFSAWDGSHRGLTKAIKESMNDPSSYDHVETRYLDRGDHLIVTTIFRGKNAFGGVVKNSVTAKVDLNGNVIEVIQ